MKQKLLRVLPVIAAFLLFAGGAYALNEHNLASLLGVNSGSTEALDYDGTVKMNSAYIGQQGTGGVTFFNGTIVNSTTDDDGNENPVTFGDDVRIDGEIFRTERNGDNAVKVDDDLEVDGDITADNLFTQTDSDALYVSQSAPTWDSQTYYKAISHAAFTPGRDSFTFWNQGYVYAGNGEMSNAHLDLPHGAVVTGLTADVTDNSAGAITVRAYRLAQGAITELAEFASVGQTAGNRTFTDGDLTSFTVDNENNSYHVYAGWSAAGSANLNLTEVRVEYTLAGPGGS